MAWNLGGQVTKCDHREYGFAEVKINNKIGGEGSVDALFEGLGDELQVHEITYLS
jgi:GMP synthase (glutamine-hydrolysing)